MSDTRARLAEAARTARYTAAEAQDIAAALLPVVERIANERAADVLDQAMLEDRTTVAKLSPVERLTCFLVKGEDLVTRAAALRVVGEPADGA